MNTALLLLIQLAGAGARGVNWYVASGNVAGNAALVAAHGDALTGAYLCCNLFTFMPNGSFAARFPPATTAAQIAVFTSQNVEPWVVGGVAEAAVHSGAWAAGLADAARVAADLLKEGVEGIIIDYEPVKNYTNAHAAAYAAFLGAFAAAITPLRVGMDIADWSILGPDYWPHYEGIGVSRFTSMTPTYVLRAQRCARPQRPQLRP
jgi:hypothetical protein